EVDVTAPSAKQARYVVAIRSGESAVQLTFYVRETGVYRLTAQDSRNSLLPAGNSVLVRTLNGKARGSLMLPGFLPAAFMVPPHRLFLTKSSSPSPLARATIATPPRLLFLNTTEREILADGKDFARLQVFLMDPHGQAAPHDIKVWLSWSNG